MFKNNSRDLTDTSGPMPGFPPAARREVAAAAVVKLRCHWPFTVETACAAQMLAPSGSAPQEGQGSARFVT